MKSFVLLAAMLGGFGSLDLSILFLVSVGTVYMVAFASRATKKGLKKSRAADL